MKHLFLSIKKWLTTSERKAASAANVLLLLSKGGESMKGNPLLDKGGVPGGRGGLIASFRNPGIIVGGLMMVFIAGFIFRDKLPFFSATGNDPVAYWKFDEGTGSTAYDTVGSNDGTLGTGNSAPSWVTEDQCISGKCLRFDGTNDYVTVGDMNGLDNVSTFTLSFWVKPITLKADGGFISKRNSDNSRILVTLGNTGYGGSDDVMIGIGNGGNTYGYTEGNIISANQWVYLTVVYNGGGSTNPDKLKLYKNGESQNLSFGGTIPAVTASNSDPLEIGRENISSRFMNGFIDEPKIYDYARSADQIKADYASRGTVRGVASSFGNADTGKKLSDGLVGYWKMDEVGVSGSAWTAVDSSGNNNAGVGVTDAGLAVGKFGNGGSFDGTDDYLRTPLTSTEFDATNEITINAWFKGDSLGSLDELVALSSIQGRMGINSGNNEELSANIRIDSTVTNVTGSTPLSPNTWYMGTFTVKSGVLNLYVNGVLDGQNMVAGAGDINIGSGTWNIAKGAVADRYFDGTIDEVRFYNRALDPSEVQALYQFAPGPVGYWKMDDNSGTSAIDSSGNSNTATLTSGPTWTSGKFGNSVNFDGSDDHVVSTSAVPANGGKAMTVEAWINKTIGSTGTRRVLAQGTDGAGEYSFYTSGTSTFFRVHGGSSKTIGPVTISEGSWVHLAGVVDGAGNSFYYVNGILSGTETAAGISGSNNLLYIGSKDSSTERFQGKIDDVKVYNYARNSSQIVEDMNAGHPAVGTPVGSTVLHLKMDEGYGTTTQDWSPQNNDGNLASGTAAPSWTNDGKFGKALSFDGTADYVTVADSSVLRFTETTPFSMSLWFKLVDPDFSNTYEGVIVKRFANDRYWILVNSSRQIDAQLSDGTNNMQALSTSTVSDNIWYYVTFVYDGANNLKVYLNGKLEGSDTSPTLSGVDTTGANLEIGRETTNNRYFDGLIDEVKIYPFALTDAQVKTDYNQGKTQTLGARSTGLGGTAPDNSNSRSYCVPGDSSTCSTPVGEWRLDQSVGSTAPDTSTNGNNGTLINGPTWKQGKFGNALSLDGVDDYITMGDNDNLDFGTSSFSYGLWFKSSDVNAFAINKYLDSSSTGYELLIGPGSTLGAVTCRTRDGVGAELATTHWTGTNDGKWHFAICVYDRGDNLLKLYGDGELRGSVDVTGEGSVSNSTAFQISARDGSNFPIEGEIDQVRVYNYARTPAQIAWEYNKGAPLAYYKFNECTGTTANDWAPNANGGTNGNNGTISIGSTGTQTSAGTCTSGNSAHAWNNGATGKYNGSLNFDGSDDYVTVADNSLFDFAENNDFSVSAWVKPANISANHAIFVKKTGNGAGAAGYMTYINNQGKIATYISDATDQVNKFTKDTVTASAWYHIVMVYKDDTSVTMYINGNDAGGTISGTIANVDDVVNASPFAIGAESDRDMVMEGQIDEVKTFNYALTQKQIQTDYASGAVRFN